MALQDAQNAINELIRHTETLAALGALLSGKAGDAKPHPAAAGKYQAVQRAIDPALLDGVTQDEARALRATLLARTRRALELAEIPDQLPGWTTEDPVVLQTQGKSSGIVAKLISDYAQEKKVLKSLLTEPGRFLDVGSGAGWISIAMADRWPALRVDGLDILQPALDLAAENAEASSVASRVAFRNRSVDELDAADAYSAAFIPFIFIPEAVLRRALPRLDAAIRAGGWLFVACYRKPEAPLDISLWDSGSNGTESRFRVWRRER